MIFCIIKLHTIDYVVKEDLIMNENIDKNIINHKIITSKYIIDCLEKPMLTVAVTSLVQIATGLFVSVLNTCQTYRALEIYRNYISRQIDEVSEISGISKSVLEKFYNKLCDVIDNRKIRPTDFFQCETFDINAVGYGDNDRNSVNRNSGNNLFKMFWDGTEFDENEEEYQFYNLPLNEELPVLLDKREHNLLINIAKNTQTFLTQCNETVTKNDIDFLNLDLLAEFISVENETFTLKIDDEILNALSEKFPDIKKESLKRYIVNAAKKFSEDPMNSLQDGKEAYVSDIRYWFLDEINKEKKYFQPEIYKDIIVNNNILSDSFFQVHYFQCIFFACMIYCLNFNPQVRKAIIIKIIDVREIFQKAPAEFAKTKFALLAKDKKISKPEQILDFIIGFIIEVICQKFVNQNDYVKIKNIYSEIKTIIKNLYDFLYSEEARQKVEYFHVTQSNLLRPQKQLLSLGDEELGSVILVDFKTAYKIVVGEELDLSPDLEEIYKNWPDEVKSYEYARTSVKVSKYKLDQWEPKKIINYINYFSREQLFQLSDIKISDCILYIRNLNNNYLGELKQKKFTKFIELIPQAINYLSLEEIIEWHQFINIEAFAELYAKQCIDLIKYFKENDNLSEEFAKKIFYSFDQNIKKMNTNNKESLKNIFNEKLFEKMVIYKDYIDFCFIDFGNDDYYCNLFFINPFLKFIYYKFKRDDIKLLTKKISKRKSFLIRLINHINDFTKEIIYENLLNVSYESFNNLYQTNFEDLLNIFIEKKGANFEILQKMFFVFLSRRFYNENLMLKKMFDFIISCEIGDDAQNIEKTKLYFKLLLASAAEEKYHYFSNYSWITDICDSFLNYIKYGYDIFLSYASRKKKKIPKCILESLKENFLNKSYNLAFTIMSTAFTLISIAITVLTFAVPFIPLAIGLSSLVSFFAASAVSFIAKGFCVRKKILLRNKYKDFFNNILWEFRNDPEALEMQIEFFAAKISMFEKKQEKSFDKACNLTFTITGITLIAAAVTVAILTFAVSLMPFGVGLGVAIGLSITGLASFSTFAFNHKNKKQKSNRVIVENHDLVPNLNVVQEVPEQQNMQIQNHENNQQNGIPPMQNNEMIQEVI